MENARILTQKSLYYPYKHSEIPAFFLHIVQKLYKNFT